MIYDFQAKMHSFLELVAEQDPFTGPVLFSIQFQIKIGVKIWI